MTGSQAEPPGEGPAAGDASNVRYDSFLVRIWVRADHVQYARVDVQHIQTDHSATATDVDLQWIASEISRLAGARPPE
jgi:hypothetical protein